MTRSTYEGCAALMLVLTMDARGQRSMFRRRVGRGLNLITLSMMPKRMPISQMDLWLRSFERSGHAMPPRRAVPPFWRVTDVGRHPRGAKP